jgi:hypothetical protein
MADRVSFSDDAVDIFHYAFHHQDLIDSLHSYFSQAAAFSRLRFEGYTDAEVDGELAERIEELEKSSAMTILSAIEAAFRIDFLQRCYLRKKDALSRAFRDIYKSKGLKIAIDDDIFTAWKNYSIGGSRLIGELRGAFRYRHWLAHGRYWEPKLGRRYDYISIYELAETVLSSFPLLTKGR